MMGSEYTHDFFIYLDVKGIDEVIGKPSYNIRNKPAKEIIAHLEGKYQEVLKKYYDKNGDVIKLVNSLTEQLGEAWDIDINAEFRKQPSSRKLFNENEQLITEEEHISNTVKLINYYYLIRLAYDDWKTILYLPGIVSKGFKNIPLGVNIGLKEVVPLEVILFLKRAVLLFFTRQSVDYFEEMAKRETIKHGTKSAVLSIAVRNLSHNICSHVLAYWIQELNQLLQDSSSNNPKLQDALYKYKALFRYIQHRADFLAEIATSIPCSEMTFDIEKDILNPFMRNNKSSNPFDKISDGTKLESNVYVLIRYITESEGITINFDVNENGITNSKAKKKIIGCEINNKINGNDQPIWVSIPSGLIGKHAIYSILENFIRNAAKHYKGDDNGNNGFIKIKATSHNDDYIKVEITDIRKTHANRNM